MKYNVHLTLKSSNRKTGPIPVSTTTRATCPDRCALKSNGCYAEGGPIKIHWDRVTRGETGMSWAAFCKEIAKLPEGQLWRHNQAGDLPGDGHLIDEKALSMLARANDGRDGFTYTHYNMDLRHNREAVFDALDFGFVINVSCDSLDVAAEFWDRTDMLTTVVLPPHTTGTFEHTYKGPFGPTKVKVVTCPATYKENVSCMTCKLCANPHRDHIIGFPAHGFGVKKVVAMMAAERMGL